MQDLQLKTLEPLENPLADLVEKLQGAGEMSLRGLARLLGRDVRRVWDDVHALLDSGIFEKNDGGKLFVPYAEITADFTLRKVA